MNQLNLHFGAEGIVGRDVVVDGLSDAVRGFLSALEEEGAPTLAPGSSEKLTEALLEDPAYYDEIRFQNFLATCKLSRHSLVQLKRRRKKIQDEWKKGVKGHKHYTYKRKLRRETMRRHREKYWDPYAWYSHLQVTARRLGFDPPDKKRLLDICDKHRLRTEKPEKVKVVLTDPSLGYVSGNMKLWVDGIYLDNLW